jgi:hypothetical protein
MATVKRMNGLFAAGPKLKRFIPSSNIHVLGTMQIIVVHFLCHSLASNSGSGVFILRHSRIVIEITFHSTVWVIAEDISRHLVQLSLADTDSRFVANRW